MAQQVMKWYYAYLGTKDISSDFAKVNITHVIPPIDNTPMNTTGSRTYIPGVPEGDIDFEGYWSEGTDEVSEDLNTYQSANDTQLILYATGGATPYFHGIGTTVGPISVIRSEEIGDIARIRFVTKPNSEMIHVAPLYNLTTRSVGTSNGNGYNLGAVAAGQSIYGFLCITAITGAPTITVSFRSAPSEFGVYTNRFSFTAATGPTTEKKVVYSAGGITDTWWQQYWVISGTGTVTFTSAIGFK